MHLPGLGLISGGPLEGLRPAVTGRLGEYGADRRSIVHGTDVGPGQLPPLPVEDGLEGQFLLGRLEPALLPGDEVVLQPAAAEMESALLLLHDGVQVGDESNWTGGAAISGRGGSTAGAGTVVGLGVEQPLAAGLDDLDLSLECSSDARLFLTLYVFVDKVK